MTEMKLTELECARIELHFSEHSKLKQTYQIMMKDKELLENKAQIANLISRNAQLELETKQIAIENFKETIKKHQENYESGLQANIKDRLGILEGDKFSYSLDTLEVQVSNKQTEKPKEKG